MEEARHFTFYRKVFTEILKRDRGSAGRTYVTVTSSDGRGTLFSYQELFNSAIGEAA